MKSTLITLFFLLSACSTQQSVVSIPVVYTSTWKQEHDAEVTEECREQAAHLTLVMFEAHNRTWSVEDVMRVEHLIFMSCLKYNNQFI